MEPLFRHLLGHSFLFVLLFFFKFEWSTIIVMVRKINQITIIISSWFIPIVLPKTFWCLRISTLYSIKFSKGITTSVFWASSICVLFISVIQYYFFISFIYCCACNCCAWNCYSSFKKYVCIAIITYIWFFNRCFEIKITIFLTSFWFIIYFNPISYSWFY